jgi:hypothetical protein
MIAYVRTRYAGPSTRGSRITAKAVTRLGDPERLQVSIPWDHALTQEENHKQAVFAVLAKVGMIRGDYTLDGFRDEKCIGHWCVTSTGIFGENSAFKNEI